MPRLDEAYTEDFSGLTRWELNVFLVMSSLAGAFLLVIVSFLIPRLVEPLLELPRPVWFGLGFFVLMWTLFPALRAHARFERPPRILSWRRFLTGTLIGALVGALVFTGLQTWMVLS